MKGLYELYSPPYVPYEFHIELLLYLLPYVPYEFHIDSESYLSAFNFPR